ncbi:hypothetical protein GOV14_00585 [Candidatus Pacearchaeota archaeon]|nr:hypothetical protein [Candidatus Pacearchaeota archaeon]
MKKGLRELKRLKKRNSKHFIDLLDICEPHVKIFWRMFGFDFRDLKNSMPSSEKALFDSLPALFRKDIKIVKKAFLELFGYLDEASQIKYLMQKDILSMNPTNILDRNKRQRVEYLQKNDYVAENRVFIPKRNLVDFIMYGPEIADPVQIPITTSKSKESLILFSQESKEYAYKLYIDNGRHDSDEYLQKMTIKRPQRRKLLDDFETRFDLFTGKSSNISVSHFERVIEDYLKNLETFYRRQVFYKELVQTNRRYVADFVVGDTIIEVASFQDCFIHDDDYMDRLRDKQKLAQDGGYNFLVLDEFTNYKKALAGLKSNIPESVYVLDVPPSPRCHGINKTFLQESKMCSSKRKVYFASQNHSQVHLIGKIN